jgi:hypothetical protein
MSEQTETLLTRNLFQVFGERDAAKRHATIAEIWAKDGLLVDPHRRFVGHEEVDAAVGNLHRAHPDFVFTVLGLPQAFNGIGRLAWGLGLPGKPQQITGLDILTVQDGRIAALYVFLDASAGTRG